MSKVQDIKKSSLTFAPEAGSQRLRNVINKGLTEEQILNGCALAFKGGWNKVKLYFMLGLPTETISDMQGIAELSEKVAEEYYKIPKGERIGKVSVTASSSFLFQSLLHLSNGRLCVQRSSFYQRLKLLMTE